MASHRLNSTQCAYVIGKTDEALALRLKSANSDVEKVALEKEAETIRQLALSRKCKAKHTEQFFSILENSK